MYQIKCDDYHLYDYRLPELIVTDPKLKIAVNTVGEASFVIHNEHPYFSKLKVLKSIFEISDEIGVIFRGRMTNNSYDFHNSKAVDLEGLMAFFNDSVVRPFKFPEDFKENAEYITASESGNVVRFFLKWLIDNHNSQVEAFQKFKLGNVTVSDPNNYITRSESKYSNTWEILKNKLFDSALGGYLCIRYENDGNYIDYLSEFELTNTQEIQYGENLIDLKNEIDAVNTYSAVIPLGAEVETEKTDENGEKIKKVLDLSDIADGTVAPDVMKKGDTIYSISAVEDYGWIYAPVEDTTWSDVTIASRLLSKAIEYLTGDAVKVQNNIEISAVDLHFTDAEIGSFRLYRNVKVNSLPHGQEAVLPLTSLNIDLLKPQNTKIVLGRTQRTLSEITNDRFQSAIDKIQGSTDELKGKYSSTQNSLNDLATKLEGAIEGTYLYIMYSAYENGQEMSTDPDENTMYMGTCSTNSATRPTDHTKYTWVRVRGIGGDSLQVKYLNSATPPTITDNDVSSWGDAVPAPEKGKKTYMTQKLTSETNWSTPIQISGEDAVMPTFSISENGYWIINGEETDSKAQGETPNITVGANGNWYVDGKDSGTKAQGEQGKDGADIEYVYYRSKNAVTNLSAPEYTNGTLTSDWTASPQGITETYKYEYVSVRKKAAGSSTWGSFSAPIIWSKWGEKGTDGDGIEYKYYLSNSATKPTYSASNAKWTDDPTGVSETNMYEYVVQITHHGNGSTTTSDVSLWAKWGQTGTQGPKGNSLEVKYKNSATTPTITNNNVSGWSDTVPAPETGKKTYMIQKLSNETNWSTPIQITGEDGTTPTVSISSDGYWIINGEKTTSKAKGEKPTITVGANGNWLVDGTDTGTKAQGEQGKDGADIEYVYYRSKNAVTNLSAPEYTNGTLTSDWTASPQGITETYKYEYVSVRKKAAGSSTWGSFSAPIIWSKWGEKGTDGDGIEYKYYLSNSSTKPTYSASSTKWTDDPTGVSASNMYEYVVQITHHGNGTADSISAVSLWAKWGETGKTQYWHIKYSNDGGATLTGSDGEELGSWIGTYVDFIEADSTDPKKYTWKKFTEEVDEELEDIWQVIENCATEIVRNTQEITLMASKEYVETSALNSYKEEVDSKFTQTADSIDMQFTKATTQINNVNGDLQSKFEKISKYITFNENGITIGGGANAMTLSLDNDTGIVFSKNGAPFGWWDGVDFHTGNLVVTVNERAQFGDFAFIPRSSGSLSFLKINGSATGGHTHSYTSTTTQSATCTEPGVMAYICSCGATSTQSIAALGHSYSSVVTPPTATAQGYTTYTCTRCGNSYVGDYTSATGCSHSSTAIRYEITKDATCTTAGSRNKITYCTSCNAVISSVAETIQATGHNYVNGTCSNCGATNGGGTSGGTTTIKVTTSGASSTDVAYINSRGTTEVNLTTGTNYTVAAASPSGTISKVELYMDGTYAGVVNGISADGKMFQYQTEVYDATAGKTLEYKVYFTSSSSGGGTTATYYTVTVNSSNTSWGTVSGGGSYPSGTSVTITATPKSGYKFVQWNDGNTNASRPITVTGTVTYTATFATDTSGGGTKTITLGVNSTSAGSISVYQNGVNVTKPPLYGAADYIFNIGDTVKVTATVTVGSGYTIGQWTRYDTYLGVGDAGSSTYEFTVSNDTPSEIRMIFNKQ